jgi:hypothetical protein
MDKLKTQLITILKVIYEKLGVGDVYAITMTTGTEDVNNMQKLLRF